MAIFAARPCMIVANFGMVIVEKKLGLTPLEHILCLNKGFKPLALELNCVTSKRFRDGALTRSYLDIKGSLT
jgi:hypothetical protein